MDAEDPTTFGPGEKSVRILKGVRPAQSVRPVGYDIVQGVTVLRAGEVIRAAEVGAPVKMPWGESAWVYGLCYRFCDADIPLVLLHTSGCPRAKSTS